MSTSPLQNNKGQSLIQAMIAIGLISIVSAFIAQLLVDQHKQIRSIEMKQEAIDLRNLLTMTFMASTTCCPVGNTSIADYVMDEGSSTDIPVQSIFSFCSSSSNPNPPALVKSNTPNSYKYFEVKNISLINITRPDPTGAPSKYLANIKVDMVNKDSKGRTLNPILIPISFSTSTIATEPVTSLKRTVSACSNIQGASTASTVMSGDFTNGRQIYDTPGTYTFTIPAGVNKIKVELWGAGSGAGAGATGAAGAYSMDYFSVSEGTNYQVYIGKMSNTASVSATTFGTLLSAGGARGCLGGLSQGKFGIDGSKCLTAAETSTNQEGYGEVYSCSPTLGPAAPYSSHLWGSGGAHCYNVPAYYDYSGVYIYGHAVITW